MTDITPLGPFYARIHREEEVPEGTTIQPGWFSWVLSELWFPHLRGAPRILLHPALKGQFPSLAQVAQESLPELFAGETTIAIVRDLWIKELRDLAACLQSSALSTGPNGLYRYFFAPMLPPGTPLPVYSQCKLRTGAMIAGFDLCQINRNWDGMDRVEDLTSRDVFTDASGDIAIVKRPLSTHLNDDLLALADTLERQSVERMFLSLRKYDKEQLPDALAWNVLERAEHWRVRWGVPDYAPARISQANQRWVTLIDKKGSIKEALDLGAYLSEMMRASWGGQYRVGELPEDLSAQKKSRGEQPERTLRQLVAYTLQLPFDCEVAPIEKAVRGCRDKRKVDWGLQLNVLGAQRRQRRLLLHLGQRLFHPDQERNHAALRLLDDIQDGRIDRLMIEVLERPGLSVNDRMHILERLSRSRMPVPPRLLVSFILGDNIHVGVAARALVLLGKQGWESLPEVLVQRLAGRSMLPLRPLARKLLEDFASHPKFAKAPKRKQMKAHTKKVLRSLGPIPPATSPEQLLPEPPPPLLPLPMLSELLEDSSNPARHEAALRIVMMYPNRDEEQTLGAALADPDPELRTATIGLLASCDDLLAKQLLETRAMFEQDPLCRRLIQVALTSWK